MANALELSFLLQDLKDTLDMKYDLSKKLLSFSGEPIKFTESGKAEGEECTIKSALQLACVSCTNPEYTKTGVKKYEVYKLLQKVHAADGLQEFSAEEVTMLKTLVADFFNVAVQGALWDFLEDESLAV